MLRSASFARLRGLRISHRRRRWQRAWLPGFERLGRGRFLGFTLAGADADPKLLPEDRHLRSKGARVGRSLLVERAVFRRKPVDALDQLLEAPLRVGGAQLGDNRGLVSR